MKSGRRDVIACKLVNVYPGPLATGFAMAMTIEIGDMKGVVVVGARQDILELDYLI